MDAEVSFLQWFYWARTYAATAGMDISCFPYHWDMAAGTLFWKDRPVFQSPDPKGLLPVADAHFFGEWADQAQGQYLVLHAASLELDGRALLLVGASGAGKSTMASALIRKGFRYLGDEFSLVDRDTLKAVPFPKGLNFKASGLRWAKMARHDFGLKPYPSDFLPGYEGAVCGIPRPEIVPAAGERFPVAWVVMLEKEPNGGLATVESWQAVRRLIDASWDVTERGFHLMAALARQATSCVVGRNDPAVTANQIRKWTEGNLRKALPDGLLSSV